MSFFLLKSLLAAILLAAAVTSLLSMFTMMGKAENNADPKTLKKIHKISGWLFLLLLLPLLYLGMTYWIRIGDQASIRTVFHAVLALGLIITALLKTVIVKIYKKFIRFAPGLGMLVFCLTFVVFAISAGYYALNAWIIKPFPLEEMQEASLEAAGNANRGASLFKKNCLYCHHPDSEDKKVGPGLKNLFVEKTLSFSKRPATVENVKRQLLQPIQSMPSFAELTEQEMADLIAYLETL
jgi:mono/diheme cytochrome c family protein